MVVDSYKADGVEDTGVAWSVWTDDPDGFHVEVTCCEVLGGYGIASR